MFYLVKLFKLFTIISDVSRSDCKGVGEWEGGGERDREVWSTTPSVVGGPLVHPRKLKE